MIEMVIFRKLFNLLRDMVFAACYLKTLPPKQVSASERLLGCGCLFLPLLMWNAENGGIFYNALVRLLFRGLCFLAYIRLTKEVNWRVALYDAFLIDAVCTLAHNVFLTPVTRPFLLGTVELIHNDPVNHIVCFLINNLVVIAIYVLVWKTAPLVSVVHINRLQTAILFLVLVGSLYLNQNLKFITDYNSVQSMEFSVYAVILQVVLLLCIIFMERLRQKTAENLSIKVQMFSAEGMLKSIRAQQENDNRLRQMRHDLKNHMHSLSFLIQQGKTEQALQYMEDLTGTFLVSQIQIQTGHPVLDGLLNQKVNRAEQLGIVTSVSADFDGIQVVDDVDLCIIFGNLLDNAIEACERCRDVTYHYIDIRGGRREGQLFYVIKNSFDGAIKTRGSILHTTKEESNYHGIGLKSVKNVLEKYHGFFTFHYDREQKQVSITVMIPVQESGGLQKRES